MSNEYPGRRLRCDGCGERVVPDDAYDHFTECGATLAFPYRPDRVRDGEQVELGEFA